MRISRASGTLEFPADFLLVACCNPCPCGRVEADCRCRDAQRARYPRRLSAPLLDRFDLRLAGTRRSRRGTRPDRPRACARAVAAAVDRQRAPARRDAVAAQRAHPGGALEELVPLAARRRDAAWRDACRGAQLTGRGAARIRRVARTLADLDDRARDQHATTSSTRLAARGPAVNAPDAQRPAGRGGDTRLAPPHHARALAPDVRAVRRAGGRARRGRRRPRRGGRAGRSRPRATISRSCGHAPPGPTRPLRCSQRRGTHVWIAGDDDSPIREAIPARPPVLLGEGRATRRARARRASRSSARAPRRRTGSPTHASSARSWPAPASPS